MSRLKKFIPASIALLPYMVLAQNNAGQTGGIEQFIDRVGRIINRLIPITVSLALLFFFYGLARYIFNANDTEKKEEGKNIMIWGVLALFVMMSVWGIVSTLQNFLGVSGGGSLTPPSVNQTSY